MVRETYGGSIKVFNADIPRSAKAAEISAEGKSIFAYDPKGKVAEGYRNLTKEVLKIASNLLKDGQKVRINGETGIVEIL